MVRCNNDIESLGIDNFELISINNYYYNIKITKIFENTFFLILYSKKDINN